MRRFGASDPTAVILDPAKVPSDAAALARWQGMVQDLQSALAKVPEGAKVRRTGTFDDATQQAVQAFKKDHQLPRADSPVVDVATAQALDQATRTSS